MKIQSLSVVVPAKRCVNDCKFCVSKMHEYNYENMITGKNLYYNLYLKDYLERLQYARDNGCNTVMLTGDCEPLQSWSFLKDFGIYNQMIANPFKIIEIQTTGNMLTHDYLYFLRHHVGVTTISLSVSDIWDSSNNADIIGCDPFDLKSLCRSIKKYRFNLRLSLNMTKHMLPDTKLILQLFNAAKYFGADQVTFRKMYHDVGLTDEDLWLRENDIEEEFWGELKSYVQDNGEFQDMLEYGRAKYDVHGMGVVVDDDCMSKEGGEVAKYVILRPDCKLYSKWYAKASLIF